jgi:hypothetical protein
MRDDFKFKSLNGTLNIHTCKYCGYRIASTGPSMFAQQADKHNCNKQNDKTEYCKVVY